MIKRDKKYFVPRGSHRAVGRRHPVYHWRRYQQHRLDQRALRLAQVTQRRYFSLTMPLLLYRFICIHAKFSRGSNCYRLCLHITCQLTSKAIYLLRRPVARLNSTLYPPMVGGSMLPGKVDAAFGRDEVGQVLC